MLRCASKHSTGMSGGDHGADLVFVEDEHFDDLKGDFTSGLLTTPDLPTTADYMTTESFTADTNDSMDHTFCGIMFNVRCRTDTPPIEFIQIQGVRVRGDLGRVRVYVREHGYADAFHSDDKWLKMHDMVHSSSLDQLVLMEFSEPVVLCPGDVYGVYVHSSLPGDTGIVYDNQRGHITLSDGYLDVLPGAAHLNPEPFRNMSPWGTEGWRMHRQLAGGVSYGVSFRLWTPMTHNVFPGSFKRFAALSLWTMMRAGLPTDIALHVLNMCKFNWTTPNQGSSVRTVRSGLQLLTLRQDGTWSGHPQRESVVTVNYEHTDSADETQNKTLAGASFEIFDPTSPLPHVYHEAVEAMMEGEKALVIIEGSRKSARTTLQLVKVSTPTIDVDASIWTKVLEAERRKDAGNTFYAAGHIEFAQFKYEKGLEFFSDVGPLSQDEMKTVLAVFVPLLTNSAACSLELKDYHSVLRLTSSALRYDADNIKALTRRAKAYFHLGNAAAAIVDIDKGLSLDPDNTDLQTLKTAATAEEKRNANSLKSRLRNMFS